MLRPTRCSPCSIDFLLPQTESIHCSSILLIKTRAIFYTELPKGAADVEIDKSASQTGSIRKSRCHVPDNREPSQTCLVNDISG